MHYNKHFNFTLEEALSKATPYVLSLAAPCTLSSAAPLAIAFLSTKGGVS